MATSTTMGTQNRPEQTSRNVLFWALGAIVILAFVIFYSMRHSSSPTVNNVDRSSASTSTSVTNTPDATGAAIPAGTVNNNGAAGTNTNDMNRTTGPGVNDTESYNPPQEDVTAPRQ